MKQLRIRILTMFISLVVVMLAVSNIAEAQEPTVHQKCELLGEVSQSIMQLRQFGVPMTKMMKKLEEGHFVEHFKPSNPEGFNNTVRNVIASAYTDYPNYTQQSSRDLVMNSFVSNWVAACYEHFENR